MISQLKLYVTLIYYMVCYDFIHSMIDGTQWFWIGLYLYLSY